MEEVKILLVDDEQDILDILSFNLLKNKFAVITACNGEEAVAKAKEHKPDLIVLDIMMPKKNGIEACKEIRKIPELKDTAVIFLTAMVDEESEIHGLDVGADDYITKPIKPQLFLSKVKATLRRLTNRDERIVFDNLEIDRGKFTVIYKGLIINLPRKEFELFALLASEPGRVFLRQEILDKVWGTEVIVGDRTIDVHIRKIRKKLDADFIKTVKGVGYKFEH
jgi:two-component system, OmpR family, alkaline phosphatase synthesis response regulator PhoP